MEKTNNLRWQGKLIKDKAQQMFFKWLYYTNLLR